jgi:cyclophilin family peptidyl-prolyl cis-trans isomerase
MKTKLLLVPLAVLALSGCSQTEAPETTKGREAQKQAEESSLLSKAIDTTQKARQDVNKAAEQENRKLNQALNETDMRYIEQYDGAILHTNQGDIALKFYSDDAPLTVNNFLKLADEKFYDGTAFHRVIKGFMIQGGDPNSKDDDWSNDGIGGPGYTVPAEIKRKNVRGAIATARQADQVNPKKESSGSQFFINTVDNGFLDGQYTVFGEVVSGMDVVDKIENAKTNQNDHPLEDMTVQSIELVAKKQ